MPRTAVWYGDESYRSQPGKCQFFLGLCRPLGDPAEAAARLRDLVLRRGGYLHFYEERPARRLRLAAAVREIGFDLLVVSFAAHATVAQARARCLTAAAEALAGSASDVVLESTGSRPDERDSRVLSNLYPREHRLRVRFVAKRDEPLVWAPDILAGAAFQAVVRGDGRYLDALGSPRWIERA